MNLSLTIAELTEYTARQLELFFPDGRPVDRGGLRENVDLAIERVEYCFKHIALPGYNDNNGACFDVLHADQYCTYLYFLSNTIHREEWDVRIAIKLYGLNKALNSFNCMHDTDLPDIFCVVHGVGTVLGRAQYRDYLVILHNVTVGAIGNQYPTMSERLVLSAGSAIFGKCTIGENVLLEPHAAVIKTDIGPNQRVAGQSPPYGLTPNTERPIDFYFQRGPCNFSELLR